MIWFTMAASWAGTTVTVPGDYDNVRAACDDLNVSTIVVEPQSDAGSGTCSVDRELLIQAADPEQRSLLPLLAVGSSGTLTLEGPLEIYEGDSGEGILVWGGSVTATDLLLDGGDRGGAYGLRLNGGEFQAEQLEVRGFWVGLYVQGEASFLEVSGGGLVDNGMAVSVHQDAVQSETLLSGLAISDNSEGIYVKAGGGAVHDSDFKGNEGTALSIGSGAGLELRGNNFIENSAAYGLVTVSSNTSIEDSFFCGNTGAGIVADGVKLQLDHVAFVGNSVAVQGTDATVEASHVSLVADGEGIKMSAGVLDIRDSLLWESAALALEGVSVSGDHNAFQARPPALGEGEGDLEIEDPGFWSEFDEANCIEPPYLGEGSVLLGAASDGEAIGAYGLWSEAQQDDTGLGSGSERTWLSGGCGGSLPAAMLVVALPLLGLRRRR